jgi:hypothetical protein
MLPALWGNQEHALLVREAAIADLIPDQGCALANKLHTNQYYYNPGHFGVQDSGSDRIIIG